MAVWSSFKRLFPLGLSTRRLAVQSVGSPGVHCLLDIETWVVVTVMEGKGQIWHSGYGVGTQRALWHFWTEIRALHFNYQVMEEMTWSRCWSILGGGFNELTLKNSHSFSQRGVPWANVPPKNVSDAKKECHGKGIVFGVLRTMGKERGGFSAWSHAPPKGQDVQHKPNTHAVLSALHKTHNNDTIPEGCLS